MDVLFKKHSYPTFIVSVTLLYAAYAALVSFVYILRSPFMSPLLVLLFASGFASVASRVLNFYRRDYTYVDDFDAFYKIHFGNYSSDWRSAFLACDEEGADLFYPKTNDEWTVVKKLVEDNPAAPNVTDVFVGVHDKFGAGEYTTINGYPTSTPILRIDSYGKGRCVTMDINTGVLEASECFTEPEITRPFVCKKIVDIVSCPTIDEGYQYIKETKKCYKLNVKEMNWFNAMKTCLMEGAILLVLESDFEAEVIEKKFMDYYATYYAGFKRLYNEEYYTVKGKKLSNTGFDKRYEVLQNECGTVRRFHNEIHLVSDECENNHPFICEMNVPV